MLLRRYMSLVGIGSARIDLVLEKDEVKLGGSIKGSFSIKGGTIEQQIKRLECDLVKTNLEEETEVVVDSTTILTTKLIDSDDSNEVPFSFYISSDLEPSSVHLSYRFKTRMVFQEGVKSMDHDTITILPN
jgi:sporulation-control protein